MRNTLENIEKYLTGEMSREERQSFNEKMKTDPDLRKQLEHFSLMDQALELAIEEDLRKELDERRREESRPKIRRLWLNWAAAAVILVLVASLMWLFIDSPSQVDQYAETHYLEYSYPVLRSEGENLRYTEGFMLLEEEGLEKSIEWFQNYTGENPNDVHAQFILADLLYQSKQMEEAKHVLLKVINSNSVLWKEKAEWNYVSIAAREDWDETASDLLRNMLQDSSHSYHYNALKLNKMISD